MGIGSKESWGDRAVGVELTVEAVDVQAWRDPNRGARAAASPLDNKVRLDVDGRSAICTWIDRFGEELEFSICEKSLDIFAFLN